MRTGIVIPEPWADDQGDTRADIPLINHASGRTSDQTDLACTMPAYTADLWWNRLSNLHLSSLKTETMPSRPKRSCNICQWRRYEHTRHYIPRHNIQNNRKGFQ
ncbi:hypothetical protein AVEN_41669-1 [Araneus ventricosus]|uniref:Uncharacterized protein n=1 Tax=Araneus ventricosus TaxID=182803 RepID=A0A4Y2I110_ARAVE|nr:hypothetical protein AVEN_41669-1 [Araneus ventricosus]